MPTTAVAVLGLVLVTALGVAALAGRWRRPWPGVLRFAALVDIALLPASYLARAFPLERLGTGFYWGFLIAAALVVSAARHRHRGADQAAHAGPRAGAGPGGRGAGG